MKNKLIVAASALALSVAGTPALAQMNMPGMSMPMPAKQAPKKPATKKKVAAKSSAKKSTAKKKTAASAPAKKKVAQGALKGMTMHMNHGPKQVRKLPAPTGPSQTPVSRSQPRPMQMPMPRKPSAARTETMPMDHSGNGQTGRTNMPMGQSPMGGMQMPQDAHEMTMAAALGRYPEQRESSGTAWQPDSSRAMTGPMAMSADWMLMAHGTIDLVYDHQAGPRGNDKAFASGMAMGMASHPLGNGTLQFRAMLSPDPLMGTSGYPLLLASGETANGRDRLIDRQHPHDFVMELSGSISQDIGPKKSLFLYAGLPGEPAFGPPSFMHRESIMDSPEAPITHHWLDSTHITFGVVTAGAVLDRFKIDASRFNGREPDQHRWDIETGPLDSTSLRVSWNPTRTLAFQGSWAHLVDPEQLEPGMNQTRWSASALWADDVARGWHAAATVAWGRKSSLGHNDDGVAFEGSLSRVSWTIFGRGEMVENRELIQGQDEPAYRVGKISVGAVRDVRIADHWSLGAGGLFSMNFVPEALAPLYGGHDPTGAMGFVRIKLN
ncbi:MAG TPA: hypothetical protein VGQ34_08140 [Sphingomicrobium sp.]|nr:hypothetical protein [Sphingomicrobium sp.]